MTKSKAVAFRFLKAFISGAATSATLITLANIHTWTDLYSALNGIILSLVIGGMNGVFMGAEKFLSWKEVLE